MLSGDNELVLKERKLLKSLPFKMLSIEVA